MSTGKEVMDDSAQKALAVLVAIAEDASVEDDTRIRAACAILAHTESVRQGHSAPAITPAV